MLRILYDTTSGPAEAIACVATVCRAPRATLWDNLPMNKAVSPMHAAPPLSAHGPLPAGLGSWWQHASVRAAGFGAIYVLLDWLTYLFPARFGVTPFNPEAAVAVALLMSCGTRYVLLIFLVVLLGEYALPVLRRPLLLMLINSAVLTAAYAAMAYLLTHRFRVRAELDTRRDVMRLIGVTFVCMLVCSIAYVGVLVSFGIGPVDRYFNGARRFFIGYSVGTLVAAPLVMMLFSEKRRAQFLTLLRAKEAWLLVAAIALCIWWVFGQDTKDHVRFFYVLFLPPIGAAARFGMVGAAGALALIQSGVFAVMHLSGYQPLSVFELQLLLITLTVTVLLLGVSVDERLRATAELRESLRLAAAGEMAAAIAHEINQPLTALSGYATAGQLLAAAPVVNFPQLQQTMDKLVEESRRTAAVVRRLRDFFRSGATRLEPVDLRAVAEGVIASLRTKADAAQVALRCEAGEHAARALVDAVQIEVVLRNLLLNAIDSAAANATDSSKGRVSVHLGIDSSQRLLVKVRDSGTGIRERDAARLFDSFVTTKSSGMGMGLAISRAIMDAHGGEIWAVPGDSGLVCFTLLPDRPSRPDNS